MLQLAESPEIRPPGRDGFPQVSEIAPSSAQSGAVDESLPAATPEESGRDPSPLDVKLPQYDGPLDLLLDLIRKHKGNIYDIPIAQITEQYLDYIRRAEELNIELGGDFVFMASTLILIKSKMLLPKDPTVPEAEQEDPRDELVQQLLDREKFLSAAEMLREKRLVEESVWSNPPPQTYDDGDDGPGLTVGIFDLVKTFETVVERFKNRPTYEVTEEEVSVASRIEFMKNLLLSQERAVSLQEVFERQPSVRSLVATFLAVLEMVKMQAIVLRQTELFGSILVRKHKMFDTVFSDQGPITGPDAEYGI